MNTFEAEKIASDNQQDCVTSVPLFYLLLRKFFKGNPEMFSVAVGTVSLLVWSQIKHKQVFQIDKGLIFSMSATLSSALPSLHSYMVSLLNPLLCGGLLFRILLSPSLNSSVPGLNLLMLYMAVQKIANISEIIYCQIISASFFFVCWHFGV